MPLPVDVANQHISAGPASTTLCCSMWAVAEASPPKSGFPQQTTEPSSCVAHRKCSRKVWAPLGTWDCCSLFAHVCTTFTTWSYRHSPRFYWVWRGWYEYHTKHSSLQNTSSSHVSAVQWNYSSHKIRHQRHPNTRQEKLYKKHSESYRPSPSLQRMPAHFHEYPPHQTEQISKGPNDEQETKYDKKVKGKHRT